jgi:hypothetical protein
MLKSPHARPIGRSDSKIGNPLKTKLLVKSKLLAPVISLLAICLFCACPKASCEPVNLKVALELIDGDEKPLPDQSARVVFGSDKDWQAPTAGHQLLTDASGEGAFATKVTLDKQKRDRTTGFIGGTVRIPQTVDHLKVAAEMEYQNHKFLYAVDVITFPGGDSTIDDFTIYSADKKGLFTRAADQDKNGWKIKELNGDLITSPGWEPWKYSLREDAKDLSGQGWTLQLVFKKVRS